jgi:hypothetical protein
MTIEPNRSHQQDQRKSETSEPMAALQKILKALPQPHTPVSQAVVDLDVFQIPSVQHISRRLMVRTTMVAAPTLLRLINQGAVDRFPSTLALIKRALVLTA